MDHFSKDVATSDMLAFAVGPSSKRFTMHSALAARQSPALASLARAYAGAPPGRCVRWEHVDEAVFFSFWEYAYTGDYRAPEETADAETKLDRERKPASGPEVRRARAQAAREAEERQRALLSEFGTTWEVESGRHAEDGASEATAQALIHHMDVHALADRCGIPALKDLAFHRLHRGLMGYPVWKEAGREGVVEVLWHCYDEVVPDRARRMMWEYAALNLDALWGVEEFRELEEWCRDLSVAITERLYARLVLV